MGSTERSTGESIESFIHKRTVILRGNDPIQRAARAMCDNEIGCIVVVDDRGHLVGVVTDRDLACFPLAFGIPSTEPLSRVMTTEPIFVEETAGLEDVIRVFIENGIRRLPVVSKPEKGGRRCVGIITLDDLLSAKTISVEQASEIIHAQLGNINHPARHAVANPDAADDRHEARAAQTAGRFYGMIQKQANLRRDEAKRSAWIFLASIYRSLPPDAARKFASPLPLQIKQELFKMPDGPDDHVSTQSVKDQLVVHLQREKHEIDRIVSDLADVLEVYLGAEDINHIRRQLPRAVVSLMDTGGASPARAPSLSRFQKEPPHRTRRAHPQPEPG